MIRRTLLAISLLMPVLASAQFVFPKPAYHEHDPSVYQEDPFVVRYRKEFFSVFRGDLPRFEKAYAEIKRMAERDPKDARALVWLGNGHTVKAGLLWMQGRKAESLDLLEKSRPILDAAVALRPKDPNIFMMRAVTLFIQGQNWPSEAIPRESWEKLRADCLLLIEVMGKDFPKASLHVRGETYGELGIAELKLGNKEAARRAFEKVIEHCAGTDYEARARKEIAALRQ